GLAARPRVHTLGLWHKSAHVFLFDSQDKLYVQLRAADKDLYPNLWDYSVGEHLQPGEGFHDAALRGLMEELGVEGVSVQALGAIRPSRFEIAELGLRDHELQQAYRAIYDGAIHPDPVEVAEVRRTPLAELARWIDDEPERFTPWFLRDLHELGLLPHES
ncbi:MAG: NUDIX domain-containing protein, partial [Gammaproteobacteria bacterium]|nr:NUDIX domain-containing protein [Gammaproteobacteria bacterium]